MNKISEQQIMINRLQNQELLQQTLDAEQVDFSLLLSSVIKQWRMILICFICSLLLSLFGTLFFIKTQYNSSLWLEVTPLENINDEENPDKLPDIDGTVEAGVSRLKGAEIALKVIDQLNLTSREGFAGEVSRQKALSQYRDSLTIDKNDSKSSSSGLINVQFKTYSRDLAIEIANTHAEFFLEARKTKRNLLLNQQKKLLESEINSIKKRIAESNVSQSSASYDLLLTNLTTLGEFLFRAKALLAQSGQEFGGVGSIIEKAYIPKKGVTPNLILNVVIVSILGLFVGFLIAIFRGLVGGYVRNLNQLRHATNIEVVGEIPKSRKISLLQNKEFALPEETSKSNFLESIHSIQAAISGLNNDLPKSIAITSANAGEGVSTIAVNLASSFQQSGKRVVLIDANLRDNQLSKLFNNSVNETLSTYVQSNGKANKPEAIETDSGIYFVSGSNVEQTITNPVELLQSPYLVDLIAHFEQSYDLVLVDCTPVANLADAMLLTKVTKATIFVVSEGETKLANIENAMRRLRMNGTNIIGIIFNKSTNN